MPLFKRTSDKAKKRLEQQLHLARHQPDEIYDISDCELYKVPVCVYCECKVFNKKLLYMQSNNLKSIIGKELNFDDLQNITVFDLSSNLLKQLPECISQLRCLRRLDASRNKLTSLPVAIGNLQCLEKLYLQGNHLTMLPSTVGKLDCLHTLDISENNVYQLPDEMSALSPALRILSIDVSRTANSMRESTQRENVRLLEEKMKSEHQQHLQQIQLAESNRNSAIENLKVNNEKMNQNLSKEQEKKIIEAKKLIIELDIAERNTSELLKRIAEDIENTNSKDELLKCIEYDRKNLLNTFLNKKQELRCNDILGSIEETVKNNAHLQAFITQQKVQRDSTNEFALTRLAGEKLDLDNMLAEKVKEKQNLMEILMNQEDVQKEAYRLLIIQKDDQLEYLNNHINILEQELCEITAFEIKQRNNKQFQNSEILVNNRKQLAILMSNFIVKKQERNKQIIEILNELESERNKTQANYWLYRYQYLMDSKPEAIANITNDTDYSIVKLLASVGAEDLTVTFSRHHINADNIEELTDESLRQMGIHQVGLRKSILQEIEKLRKRNLRTRDDIELRLKNDQDSSYIVRPPSVPGKSVDGNAALGIEPTAPPVEQNIKAFGLQSECSICIDAMATVLFLTCGHICTCQTCSVNVKICPLCRTKISSRVIIQSDK